MERRIYSDQDIQQVNQAEKELRAKGLDEQGQRIGDLIDDFFQTNRGVPVTVPAIFKLIEAQPGLKWLTPAQLEYNKIAAANPQAAQQLVDWLNTQGNKPGQLVSTGDDRYANLTLLLTELRNRREDVSATTIRNAIDRISNRPGRKLRIVEAPRRTEPISAAAKADDGVGFLHSDMVKNPDGSYRSKTPAEQRRDMESAERAKSKPQVTNLDASEAAWKAMADGLLNDGTHSQQARVRAVYDREIGNGWRRVFEACKAEVNIYKNRGIR
jgi:hypothetical protein